MCIGVQFLDNAALFLYFSAVARLKDPFLAVELSHSDTVKYSWNYEGYKQYRKTFECDPYPCKVIKTRDNKQS